MAKQGSIWLDLLGDPTSFERVVMSAIEKTFTVAVKNSIESIKTDFEVLVYNSIHECPELEELRSGTLRGELGLSINVATEVSENIARTVSESIFVEHKNASTREGIGGLIVYVQPSHFSNVLGVANSSVSYHSKKENRTIVLKWLDWLLTEGDKIIVSQFSFKPEAGRGRTGLGRMRKGGSWRISPQYAGTEDDNFITRALSDKGLQENMASIIHKEIKRNWK